MLASACQSFLRQCWEILCRRNCCSEKRFLPMISSRQRRRRRSARQKEQHLTNRLTQSRLATGKSTTSKTFKKRWGRSGSISTLKPVNTFLECLPQNRKFLTTQTTGAVSSVGKWRMEKAVDDGLPDKRDPRSVSQWARHNSRRPVCSRSSRIRAQQPPHRRAFKGWATASGFIERWTREEGEEYCFKAHEQFEP